MKNIKVKIVIYTALLCTFCTKSQAQIQWNLNAYHNYPTYIDLNCSLNGESNGKEGFAFYADNRSESKISFTVNYTITDHCGKSHSGSWSTYIIQAGQRASSFESVYIGCPIQEGKRHMVKNITCTVSNFKDLSKNESNSNANKISEQQNKTYSSTNTQSYNSNNNSTSNESASQRQYREQQERIAETQRKSEIQSKQFVENATELVGLVGNMLATNRADREKKEAKKEAEKLITKQQQERRKLKFLKDIVDNEERANNGDTSAMNQVAFSYIRLEELDNARFWYLKSANQNNSNGMLGMSSVIKFSILSKIKVVRIGKNKSLEDSLKQQIEWLKKAALLGNITAYKYLLSYLKGIIGTDIDGQFEFTNYTQLYPWSILKDNKEIINFFMTQANNMEPLALQYLNDYYFKESRQQLSKGLELYSKKDYEAALPYAQRAVNLFSSGGFNLLSLMYLNGKGVNIDGKEAFSLALKSALIGDTIGMELVSVYYKNGIGVKKNDIKAQEWAKRGNSSLSTKYEKMYFPSEKKLNSKNVVQQVASFDGNWSDFIEQNFKYPEEAVEKKIEGKVVVSFKIDEVGDVVEVKSLSGPNELFKAAEDLIIKSNGMWIPARYENKFVKFSFQQSIVFKL